MTATEKPPLRRLTASFVLALLLLAPESARAEVKAGELAPWFDLPSMGGQRVTRRSLAGRIAVLVIGRTKPSAPRCKEWTLTLLRRGAGASTYQVIVADKPWYAPRSAVLSEIRKFTGSEHAERVLVEWYTVFADAYGIPRDDDPRVLVLDRRGMVRLSLRGSLTPQRLSLVERTVLGLAR